MTDILSKPQRRDILKALTAGVAAIIIPGLGIVRAEDELPTIRANSFLPRGQYFFDPVGFYVQKGQTVRWIAGDNGPTITAFHPANLNHELRIPEGAKPFDSWVLTKNSRRYK